VPAVCRENVSPLIAEVLRNGGFLRLWGCGILLGSMRWVEVLAVGLYALEASGSAFVVASMLFVRTVPMVLLGALTGALADRVSRRWLLLLGLTAVALVTAVLLTLALTDGLRLWAVAAGAFVNGCAWTLEHPVRRALIHDVVGGDRLATAIGLDSATFNGTRMLGPLAGGALYATFGLPGVYLLGTLLYVLAASLALGLLRGHALRREQGPGTVTGSGFGADLLQGLRHVASEPTLLGVMVVTVLANLFGFSYVSMVPVLGARHLGLDPSGIGLLMSMEGLGAMIAALVLSGRARPRSYRRLFNGGATLFFIMIGAFALSDLAGLSMLALFLAGVGIATFGVMQTTLLLNHAAPAMRSRVMGVLAVCIGTVPLGVLAVGALAERIGSPQALLVSASLGLCSMGVLGLWWLRRSRHA
jgi:MFS family permease